MRRFISSMPSSNSWFPIVPTSNFKSFKNSIVGSSCNNAETGGLAPTISPACTRSVLGFVLRSFK